MKAIDPFKKNAVFDEESSHGPSRSPSPMRADDNSKSMGRATQANSYTGEGRTEEKRDGRYAADGLKYRDGQENVGSGRENSKRNVLFSEPSYQGFKDGCVIDSKELPHPVLLFTDGFYFGMLQGNKPHGYGIFCYNSGDVYVGLWKSGDPSGHGYYYFAEGGFYFGKIESGLAHGPGLVMRLQDEFYYEGKFDFGYMQGKGSINKRGEVYECILKANMVVYEKKMESKGSLMVDFPTKVQSFEEEWAVISLVSNPESKKRAQSSGAQWQNVYFGERDDKGRKHGVGSLLTSSGSRYHGMFFQDKILGFGVSLDPQGNIRTGFYGKNGMHMFGSCSIDNDLYIGGFENGVYSGPAIYKDHQMSKWIIGMFQNGEMTNSSYSGDGKVSLAHVSLGRELLTNLLQKAFVSYYELTSDMGSTVLVNRICPQTADHYSTIYVQMENMYFRKTLNRFVKGTKNSQKKGFSGKDWEGMNKNSSENTKEMYKELFQDYLDGGQIVVSSNANQSNINNNQRPINNGVNSSSRNGKNNMEDSFSFREEYGSNKESSTDRRKQQMLITDEDKKLKDKQEIKNPNFDFLDEFAA